MAVPKTTETRYIGMAVWRQDRAYKDYPSNPILTSSFPSAGYTMRLLPTALMVKKKKCKDGVTCVVFVGPVLSAHCHSYT